jgi:hypothetical protein
MGPCEDRPTAEKNQGRARRPRRRLCLLKGCEQVFRPTHPRTRYCSQECREQARRWREWKARQRYRQSDGGKQKRQAQCRRYRIRHRDRAEKAKTASGKQREGHRKKNYFAAPATARGAMRSLGPAGAHPCSDFVRRSAGGLWSGFWNGKGAGGSGSQDGSGVDGSRCGRGILEPPPAGDGPDILSWLIECG